MTLRALFTSLLSATCLASVAYGDAGAADEPHRRLVIGGDCIDCTFQDANLSGAQFLGGNFSSANFRNAELLGARLIDLNLADANLRDASLIEARLANVGLENANLRNADLDRSRLHRVRLIDGELQESSLDDAVLLIVDLSNATLTRASATEAVFRQAVFIDAEIRDADFDGAHFAGSDLTNVNARESSFNDARFENVNLTGADLRDTRFDGARFIAVNLTDADLRGAQGLDARSFRHVCGANVQGLPDAITLQDCAEGSARSSQGRADPSPSPRRGQVGQHHNERRVEVEEARRIQIEEARAAFEAALSNIEIQVSGSDRARLEAIAAAREGWEAAAEALAEVGAELNEAGQEVNWTFEIRRAELGEPIRVILEEAAPESMVVVAPAPPPSPPAPKLPEPELESELLGQAPSPASPPQPPMDDQVSAADIAFLIEASAQDFLAEVDSSPSLFRNVQAGVMRVGDGDNRPIICGQVEIRSGSNEPQWVDFATLRANGYQTWIGDAAGAACADSRTQKQASADLAIRLEQRLAELSGR